MMVCVCVCVCVFVHAQSSNYFFPSLPLPLHHTEFISDGYDHDKSVADLSSSLVINRDEFNQGR